MWITQVASWLESRTMMQTVLVGLAFAAAVEVITCVARFGLGLESTRDTSFLSRLTFGLRLHHGYLGALLLIVAIFVRDPLWRRLLIVVGGGLVVSDLVHHFLILWPIVGSPEFHLRYPR